MRWKLLFFLLLFILPSGLGIPLELATEGTYIELIEAGTGREIFSAVLGNGEQVVLTWRNSLFGLMVIEVFETQKGRLILTEVTYADPGGMPPPAVAPDEAAELYQTGGPFSAKGLAKPFQKLVFRVGEIGEPNLKIRDRILDFKKEVGFGGGIVLTTRSTDSF